MRCVREKENGNLGHGDWEFWGTRLVSGSMVEVQWSLGGVKAEENGSAGEGRGKTRENSGNESASSRRDLWSKDRKKREAGNR